MHSSRSRIARDQSRSVDRRCAWWLTQAYGFAFARFLRIESPFISILWAL